MQKIIGVTELQRHFRAVLDEVTAQQVPYVLTRGSRPEAVIISYEEFLRYKQLQRDDFWQEFNRVLDRMAEQNAAFSDEEVATDIEAAREEVASMRRAGQEQ